MTGINLGESSSNGDNYLPFAAALDAGIIQNPAEMAAPINVPPMSQILSGIVPNGQKRAGLVEFGGRHDSYIKAFDHTGVSVVDGGSKVFLMPSARDSVNDGTFDSEGCITMTGTEGSLVITAFMTHDYWLADRFRNDGHPVSKRDGLYIIGTNLPYEISDIESSSGIVTAKPIFKTNSTIIL